MSRIRHASTLAIAAIVLGVIAGGSAGGFALADQSSVEAHTQTSPTATLQRVPPRIAAAFPALGKALDASEAQQLPLVAQVMSVLAGQSEANTGGANSGLARRISLVGEDAEYLVPGNEVLCIVAIATGRARAGGCAPATSLETVGTTSLTVVPGGYELTGILPEGTRQVSVTDAPGETTVVAANANRAFHFFSAARLAELVYDLPGGGRHVGSLALPDPPHLPPPAG
jgi:hypothetical protein